MQLIAVQEDRPRGLREHGVDFCVAAEVRCGRADDELKAVRRGFERPWQLTEGRGSVRGTCP
jgi:hypothetical protein